VEVGLLFGCGRAGGGGGATGILIGGALLRRTGVAMLLEATGRLDGASARVWLPPTVARPIAKEHANTTQTETTTISAYPRTGTRSAGAQLLSRPKVFMTGS